VKYSVFYESRTHLDRSTLVDMYRYGIRVVQFGIESLTDELLRILNKGTSALQNVRLLKWCREIGIYAKWNIIVDIPNDRNEQYIEQVKTIQLIHHLSPPNVSRLLLYRFSPLFERPQEYAIDNIRPMPEYRQLFPDFTDDDLYNAAYFFKYDSNCSASQKHINDLISGIHKWKRAFPKSILGYVDDGDEVRIIMARGGRSTVFSIKNKARELFLQAENISPIGDLLERAGDEATGIEIIDDLLKRGLILAMNGKILSLPLNLGIGVNRQEIKKLSNSALPHYANRIVARHPIRLN